MARCVVVDKGRAPRYNPRELKEDCQGSCRRAPQFTSHVRVVPVEEAVGKTVAHDMTRIDPGQFKGPEFKAGQRISVGDICRLQQMGRSTWQLRMRRCSRRLPVRRNLCVKTKRQSFARRMAGEGISYELPPHEGKIDFKAGCNGLCVDVERMTRFNLVPESWWLRVRMARLSRRATLFAAHGPSPFISRASDSVRRWKRWRAGRCLGCCPCARPAWAFLLPAPKFSGHY